MNKLRRSHGNIVGNGGQAIIDDSRLYPRDLYEAKLHLDTYLGLTAHAQIIEEVSFLRFHKLTLEKTLLAHKISEINNLVPLLGSHFLHTLSLFEWVAVDEPLPHTNECGDTAVDQATLVQVATRIKDKIYVHKPSWEKLDAIHQIAILIHEAVYSLIKPRLVGVDTYRQMGPEARAIAALLFDRKSYQTGSEEQSLLMSKLQNLQIAKNEHGQLVSTPDSCEWSIQLLTTESNEALLAIQVPLHRVRANPNYFVDSVASKLLVSAGAPALRVNSMIHASPYDRRFKTYKVNDEFDQFSVVVEDRKTNVLTAQFTTQLHQKDELSRFLADEIKKVL